MDERIEAVYRTLSRLYALERKMRESAGGLRDSVGRLRAEHSVRIVTGAAKPGIGGESLERLLQFRDKVEAACRRESGAFDAIEETLGPLVREWEGVVWPGPEEHSPKGAAP
jgi:hypothetical protein